jgi:hypothetical protein
MFALAVYNCQLNSFPMCSVNWRDVPQVGLCRFYDLIEHNHSRLLFQVKTQRLRVDVRLLPCLVYQIVPFFRQFCSVVH